MSSRTIVVKRKSDLMSSRTIVYLHQILTVEGAEVICYPWGKKGDSSPQQSLSLNFCIHPHKERSKLLESLHIARGIVASLAVV